MLAAASASRIVGHTMVIVHTVHRARSGTAWLSPLALCAQRARSQCLLPVCVYTARCTERERQRDWHFDMRCVDSPLIVIHQPLVRLTSGEFAAEFAGKFAGSLNAAPTPTKPANVLSTSFRTRTCSPLHLRATGEDRPIRRIHNS